jgi:hypothetical protein
VVADLYLAGVSTRRSTSSTGGSSLNSASILAARQPMKRCPAPMRGAMNRCGPTHPATRGCPTPQTNALGEGHTERDCSVRVREVEPEEWTAGLLCANQPVQLLEHITGSAPSRCGDQPVRLLVDEGSRAKCHPLPTTRHYCAGPERARQRSRAIWISRLGGSAVHQSERHGSWRVLVAGAPGRPLTSAACDRPAGWPRLLSLGVAVTRTPSLAMVLRNEQPR